MVQSDNPKISHNTAFQRQEPKLRNPETEPLPLLLNSERLFKIQNFSGFEAESWDHSFKREEIALKEPGSDHKSGLLGREPSLRLEPGIRRIRSEITSTVLKIAGSSSLTRTRIFLFDSK